MSAALSYKPDAQRTIKRKTTKSVSNAEYSLPKSVFSFENRNSNGIEKANEHALDAFQLVQGHYTPETHPLNIISMEKPKQNEKNVIIVKHEFHILFILFHFYVHFPVSAVVFTILSSDSVFMVKRES